MGETNKPKRSKVWTVVFILVVVYLCLQGIMSSEEEAAPAVVINKNNDFATPIVFPSESDEINNTPQDYENQQQNTVSYTQDHRGAYYVLDDQGKEMYDRVLEAVRNSESYCYVDGSYYSQTGRVEKAVKAVSNDHPELFWFIGQYGADSSSSGDTVISLVYADFWQYSTGRQQYTDQVNSKVQQIAARANAYSDNYDKIRYVHDYLVENVVYDHEALEQSQSSFSNGSTQYIYTPYGCLTKGRAVCAGYAKTFQMIMHELGFECYYISRNGMDAAHAWNYMVINGEGYYIDTTWDDYDSMVGGSPFTFEEGGYTNFCMNTEELLYEHTLDRSYTIDESVYEPPVSTGVSCNFFSYYDYYMDYYSADQLADIIAKQGQRDVYQIRFGSINELNRAVEDICNGSWQNIPAFQNFGELGYMYDENFVVLSLYDYSAYTG